VSAYFTITIGGSIVQAGDVLEDLSLLETDVSEGGTIPKYTQDLAHLCYNHDIHITCHKEIPETHILNDVSFYHELPCRPGTKRMFLARGFARGHEKTPRMHIRVCSSVPFQNNFQGPSTRYLNIGGNGIGMPSFENSFPFIHAPLLGDVFD
jgi:hypothetical protein